MNFKKYHVSRNLIDIRNFTATTTPTSQDGVLWTGTLAEGTYTFSINQDDTLTSSLRNTIHIKIGSANYYESTSVNYHNNSGRHSYTFTVPDATTIIEIRYWTNDISNDCSFSQGMLNTGSTALPYEPYSSEVWHDIPHYIHNTSTDTITTLPAVIYPTGTTATVGLKGQTTQSSIPSPTSPVMPQGTGERTGNLWDEEYPNISGTIRYVPLYVGEGSFTLSTTTPYTAGVANVFLLSGNVSSGASTPNNGAWLKHKVTAQSDDGYVTIAYRHYAGTTSPADCKTMLNLGSTALPYEPYGYKIPISSASTTTPVYLGGVETTRKIRKLVLTGEEFVYVYANADIAFRINTSDAMVNYRYCVCTHFSYQRTPGHSTIDGVTAGAGDCNLYFTFSSSSATQFGVVAGDTNSFKSYLQQQYAAGTPVIVWYVLATPETAVVNEPLMKIGDYADTLSNVSIPVTAGGDTLSIGTTVQPSEVTVNYKGWHPVQNVHERDNGAWT